MAKVTYVQLAVKLLSSNSNCQQVHFREDKRKNKKSKDSSP